MLDNRIGAQFFTIRNFCKTLEGFDESCRKVSEMGYKVVQLSGIGNFTGEEVKSVLDKYNLVCACTHRAPQNYLEHLEEEIKFHKTIGCKICGLGSMVEGIQSDSPEKDGIEIVERLFLYILLYRIWKHLSTPFEKFPEIFFRFAFL